MNTRAVVGSLTLRTRLMLPAVVVLLAGLIGSPALGQEQPTFTLHIADGTAAPGVAQDFTATLVNHSAQRLGSADITLPEDFTLAGVVDPPAVNGTPQGSATQDGNVIRLTRLLVPPGGSVVVELTAVNACTAGTYDLEAAALTPASNMDPTRRPLTLDRSASALSVTVTSGCAVALRFVDGRHPADAEASTTITSVALDPGGPPPQVEAVDLDGNRATSFAGDIAVTIGDNPAGGTQSGSTTQAAVAGVADFDDLSIDLGGLGYTLVATSAGLAGGSSGPFTIYDDTCAQGETCSATAGSLEDDGMQAQASGLARRGDGALIVALGVDALDCTGDHNRLPAVTTLVGENLIGKVVDFTVSEAADEEQPDNDPARYQVCAEPLDADSEFTDRDGAHVAVGEAGLLRDCGLRSIVTPPCVRFRTTTPEGNILVRVLWGSQFKMR
jgi:hypothetical protein